MNSQECLVLAIFEEVLGDEDVGEEHVFFYQRLRLHFLGFSVLSGHASFLVEVEGEFAIEEHDGAVVEADLPPFLRNFIHQKAILCHVLIALALWPIFLVKVALAIDLAVYDLLDETIVPFGATSDN